MTHRLVGRLFTADGARLAEFVAAIAGAAPSVRRPNRRCDSAERLRLALDAGKCGVWELDVAGNRLAWSQRMYDFHGLDPQVFDHTLQGYLAVVHPADAVQLTETARTVLAQKQVEVNEIEFRIVRPTGEVRLDDR